MWIQAQTDGGGVLNVTALVLIDAPVILAGDAGGRHGKTGRRRNARQGGPLPPVAGLGAGEILNV